MGLSLYHHRWFLAILAHTATTAVATTADLDAAILTDLLHQYVGHDASQCDSSTSSETTFTFIYPGVNSGSEWSPQAVGFEESLFQAMMSHTDGVNDKLSWEIRIGTSGNMYSHFVPNAHGETMSPQNEYVHGTPWVDEVSQMVSVNNALNYPTSEGTSFCPAGSAEQDCPKYFIHQAGAYAKDSPYTDPAPFYSPSLAKACAENWCAFASWGTQAHVAMPYTSPIMYITKFLNCGNGVIEHSQMIHNFAKPGEGSAQHNQNYFNVGWGGVRSSNLPFALEPRRFPETNGEHLFEYENPNTVRYLPLCPWGSTPSGPMSERAETHNLNVMGGYTTFVADGLLVNRTHEMELPCRKPIVDGINPCVADPSGCMVESCTDDNISNGYYRVALAIRADITPTCVIHDVANPFGGYVALKCSLRRAKFTGQTKPYASSPDSCAPWKNARIGFRNPRTGGTLEVAYVRHWSWSVNDFNVFFSVFVEDTGVAAQTKAKERVINMFQSRTSWYPIELITVNLSSVKPSCRKPATDCSTDLNCMVPSCSEYQIGIEGYVRIELGIRPGGPNCVFDSLHYYETYVGLECDLRTETGFGNGFNDTRVLIEEAPIGLYRADTGMTLEVAYVKRWSFHADEYKVYFSVFTVDDGVAGGAVRQDAIERVNAMFANPSGTDIVPLEIRGLAEDFSIPASYDPHSLSTFSYVYGKGEEYANNEVSGYGRRNIGSTVATRDYTVFTTNWLGGGVSLSAGETYLNRAFMFSSNLTSVKTTAEGLLDGVSIAEINLEEWSPRTIDVYEADNGTTRRFVVKAASSPLGTNTTHAATLVCSGKSTPLAGSSPFFYVTCGSSTYFGSNPYHFTPSFVSPFLDHGYTFTHCINITPGTPLVSLEVMVNAGSGFYPVANDGGTQCFPLVTGVRVRNTQDTPWTGSILLSTDIVSFSSMACEDCSGTTSTDQIIVSDTITAGQGGTTECLNGEWCTLLPVDMTCILVVQGAIAQSRGYIGVYVDTGNGYGPSLSNPEMIYLPNTVIVDQCFTGVVAIQVQGTRRSSDGAPNAWIGSVMLSTDNKQTYSPLGCHDCTGVGSSENIVVDARDPGEFCTGSLCTPTQCMGGERCTLGVNSNMVRSYACKDEDTTVRPSWKLMGFFDSSDPGCVGLEEATYDQYL